MKILVPGLGKTEFSSLKEVFDAISTNHPAWWYTISDIVQYNVFYRNYLKNYGYRALKRLIREEYAEFKGNKDANQILDSWWQGVGRRLGDYDIFYHRCDEQIDILGHRYNGIADIRRCVARKARLSYDGWYHFEISKGTIGEVYEAFPYYDITDPYNDAHTFQNYFFRRNIISEDDIKAVMNLEPDFNYCLVSEKIPEELLPMIYYDGEGDYILVAMKNE